MHRSEDGKLIVTWFEKHGDKVGEERIMLLSIEEICCLLDINSKKDSLKGVVHRIQEEKAHLLQPYLKHQFDFKKHTYFLGYYS